jgi:hypothetical protein
VTTVSVGGNRDGGIGGSFVRELRVLLRVLLFAGVFLLSRGLDIAGQADPLGLQYIKSNSEDIEGKPSDHTEYMGII